MLRGLGTVVALPSLEAMIGGTSFGAAPKPPVRLAFLSVPNGMHMADWTPDGKGSDFQFKSILEPVAKHRSESLMLSGLTLNGGRALGDGPGDHARCAASFLTGAHPKKTHGADIYNGISVDQVAAQKIGSQTRFASMELGMERGSQSGNCDSGYSCAYSANISWRTPTSPVAKEIDPAAVFDRLFGNGRGPEESVASAKRKQDRLSVLDFALEDARQLQRRLGANDLRKLDEYLYAVRDVEKRIGGAQRRRDAEHVAPDFPRPAGIPTEFGEHAELLFDLMTLALQTDSTRVLTFMVSNAGSNRTYPQVKVSEGHHHLSHHGNDADKQAKISRINRYHVSLLKHFLDRLAAVKESNGSLLDNCIVMYGSGLGDGNRHNHHNLPIALFGKGGGALKTGQHLVFPKDTPLTNMYRSMLAAAGADVDAFGDSTGLLSEAMA
jgi:hypothetical protein